MMRARVLAGVVLGLVIVGPPGGAAAQPFDEAPMLAERVAAGTLAPLSERLPDTPLVARFGPDQTLGRYGGSLRMFMARAKDSRQITVYGYARLVKYDQELELVPDILERVDIREGREFTLKLRPGHKWSDGRPFTSADFRYWWDEVANNAEIMPAGPPITLSVDGEWPQVETPDPTTVIYRWSKPNPSFLPALAEPTPLYIYMPAHYARRHHAAFVPPEELAKRVEETSSRNWAAMHNKQTRARDADNPDLPLLQPWVPSRAGSSDRQIFERNPYFHRVDPQGRQLPYIDEVIFDITQRGLIAGKAATGEADLQGRYLRFDDVTLLKSNEHRHGYRTLLWRIAKGAHMALYPNLTHADPQWRALLRDVRFRRALSLAINRYEINRVIYFGLAVEGQNTLLPGSPLYDPSYRTRWTEFDIDRANRLLDEMGLDARDTRGLRLKPDGEPLEIIVESPGGTEEADILSLIADSWAKVGIKLFIKPSSIEVVRNRIYGGQTVMAIFPGWENALATPDMPPGELAPIDQTQYQWSNWGQYVQTKGESGEAPDMPEGQILMDLLEGWYEARDTAERERAWRAMLEVHADNLFTIGLIAGVLQPVVVRAGLENVPDEGIWNWNPGSHFGLYGMDRFWFSDPARRDIARAGGQAG